MDVYGEKGDTRYHTYSSTHLHPRMVETSLFSFSFSRIWYVSRHVEYLYSYTLPRVAKPARVYQDPVMTVPATHHTRELTYN